MQRVMIISPQAASMLFAAAVEKGILKGKREAILARLEGMAADLFPAGTNLFASLLTAAPERSAENGGDRLRGIGDLFLRFRDTALAELREDGRFYTPVRIIDRILDMLWDDLFADGRFAPETARSICDPAMGCGYFHLRLLELMGERLGVGGAALRAWASASLCGVDKDPFAVFMARALLWLCLSDREGEFVPDNGKFVCGESLLGNGFGGRGASGSREAGESLDWERAFPEAAAAGGFDVVFGNPPYEVLTNFEAKPGSRRLAEAIRESGLYRDALSGQINLYRCFIERSLDLLKSGGIMSMVVPLSLARDASAKRLRRRLLFECRADRWRLYSEADAAFPGVTQSACVFRAWRGGGEAERLFVAKGDDAFEEMTPADLDISGTGVWAIPAVVPGATDLFRWFRGHAPRALADAADSHVGEVDQTFYRECMADDPTECVLVRGAHLTPFRLDAEPKPGKERFLRLDHFLAMKGGMAENCRARAAGPRVAQLGIRNMQSRPRLVAALVPPGVYAGNSLNIFYPRDGISVEFLAGVLNSRILDWLFRAGSGNNNINLHEMRGLPFPATDDAAAVAVVAAAYRCCADAASGGEASEDDLAGVRLALDRAVAVCYGLPEEMLAKVLAF